MEATKIHSEAFGLDGLRWDLGSWEAAKAFVERNWPDARNEGVGYWRIPRTAHIMFGVGMVTYMPMKGKPMPENVT